MTSGHRVPDPEASSRDRLGLRVRRFFGTLGPGIVTGAADDDPSGVSTYSVAGATFGLSVLWTVFLTFPLMAAVQTMCARLAVVTGVGFAAAIRRHNGRAVLWFACSLLFVANVVNIGADLAGMAEALHSLTGLHEWFWLPAIVVSLVLALVFLSYRRLASVFKWLTLSLFSYVLAALLARPDWTSVLRATFVPSIQWSPDYMLTIVAILGTTITPYMFFWQTNQEVDDERAKGRTTVHSRAGATAAEIREAQRDVLLGMGWAGLAMYFMILTTASTLHATGAPPIETAQQAAEALRPLAGPYASLLFTIGIVATGMLAVPILAGSAAYAVADALHWRGSLDSTPATGRKFYAVLILAVLVGLALDLLKVNAIKGLVYAAVLNGLAAPPLIFILTRLTSNPKVMGEHVNPPLLRALGYLTVAVMSAAAIGMVVAALWP